LSFFFFSWWCFTRLMAIFWAYLLLDISYLLWRMLRERYYSLISLISLSRSLSWC
jgi:hypothetical protein